jgi:hypothetical protein
LGLSLSGQNMKNQILWRWGLGLIVAGMPLADSRSQEAPNQLTNTPPLAKVEAKSNVVAQAKAEQASAAADQDSEGNLADAPFQPISSTKPLPQNIKPTSAVAEVIRLAEAGVEEGVMLAFVTNSASMFSLGAEDIVYLNDIGVPSAVVTAMIQRDQTLKGSPASNRTAVATAPAPEATAGPFAPVPETPATDMAPAPAPQPEYLSEDYSVPPPAEEAGYSTFYNSLSPYGTWVNVAGCGPCWQPTVVVGNPNWQPYLNGGRWVYTDCGWYWLSDYSWGWAPFHYGRWFQHSRLGWCWAPDNVWGPSWVCWRYTTSHCGWAPLPPGAVYHVGAGLTYHGRHVTSTFGFGLGARSFAFVEFGHVWDRHLHHHALPAQQRGQIFNHTVASTSIAGGRTRVINNGLSTSRVVAATHTGIHRVTIHETSVPAGQGVRAERLEPNGRTLSVSRPNLQHRPATPPSTGAPARTAGRNDNGSVAATPLILHGPSRSSPATGVNGGSAAKETYPPNSLIVTGRKKPTRAQELNHSVLPAAQPNQSQIIAAAPNTLPRSETTQRTPARTTSSPEVQRASRSSWSPAAPAPAERHYTPPPQAGVASRSAPTTTHSSSTASLQNSLPRPEVNQRPPLQTTYSANLQRPSSSSWSAPAAAPVERHSTPPSPRAVEVPRSAPAPTYAPSHTYSAPAASYTPRAAVVEPRPTYSAPSAPAASASATYSHSSSARNGR